MAEVNIPYVHEIQYGLLPNEPNWVATVTVDGKYYKAEGYSREQALIKLRSLVPISFIQCYEH